ncbi:MAG: hypothetical protein BWY54_00902 [Candidatus Dependentiae bacterium ADurb.Bin331]|nr:MAG: hypothetical protein BWY54_00902 [Candidatus Dependentiae bacterium ADurb.Bin331]
MWYWYEIYVIMLAGHILIYHKAYLTYKETP